MQPRPRAFLVRFVPEPGSEVALAHLELAFATDELIITILLAKSEPISGTNVPEMKQANKNEKLRRVNPDSVYKKKMNQIEWCKGCVYNPVWYIILAGV